MGAAQNTQERLRNSLAALHWTATKEFFTTFRVSGFKADGGGNDTKCTVAPTWAITPNVSVRAEISLGEGDTWGDYKFYGVQALLKW